jgi:hypothetical protein
LSKRAATPGTGSLPRQTPSPPSQTGHGQTCQHNPPLVEEVDGTGAFNLAMEVDGVARTFVFTVQEKGRGGGSAA